MPRDSMCHYARLQTACAILFKYNIYFTNIILIRISNLWMSVFLISLEQFSNYICIYQPYAIPHPCPNFNSG